ncbi:MAG: hypothetical protein ABIO36_00265 [Pyrinomonadaceae bacterium]
MKRVEELIRDLPDPHSARRFLDQLSENHPMQSEKLLKNEGLLSDVLTLVSFSPLLTATILQNPDYLWWLKRKRSESGVRGKDELVESLARFALTNSSLEPQVLFARFRRRELLRIYLRDVRGLATIAEITEEISNLADAILESALESARRETNNRFGVPQETDEKGRTIPARFCIAALGKLGSKELNYSSDIDLFFIYSGEGMTSSSGSRGSLTNREYFAKLAAFTAKLVGAPLGEGAAYRVDLRLRPHGSLGALALSVADTVRYCSTEARPWERQVLIRSRGCAGDVDIFKLFFRQVEDLIFSKNETIETALANVRRSKEKIDLENLRRRGFNVKLSAGGIREIEFLAQALQLAHGGSDKWLRSPHTLISLSRLADRNHLSDAELTKLSSAYKFLRRTEHVLQMENGVQTHTVPEDREKRELLARRVAFAGAGDLETDLVKHAVNVHGIFARVFGEIGPAISTEIDYPKVPDAHERTRSHILASIDKSDVKFFATTKNLSVLDRLTSVSPHFAGMLAANPQLAVDLPDPKIEFLEPNYAAVLMAEVESTRDFGQRLSAIRRIWARFLLDIVIHDIFEKINISEAKRLQTKLAEASIATALKIVRDELARRTLGESAQVSLDLAVLALGKLGGRGLDYDSDLDLVIVYFDPKQNIADITPAEFYSRAVELFTTTLSSMTRDGNLYRVDLRLRPFGSKGLSAISIDSFLGYMDETAAIWEMLAFVKLRYVGGDASIGINVEKETRRIIHERAAALDKDELKQETVRVRLALEQQRSGPRRGSEVDIKYGSGGMLDIYFAMRYLQLRDSVPDDADDRSTGFMLKQLKASGALKPKLYNELAAGYEFLSALDHNLRLTVGRTTRVPIANETALKTISARMKLSSPADLLEQLTLHRLTIREAFEQVLDSANALDTVK